MTKILAVSTTEFNVPVTAIAILQYTAHTQRPAKVARWGVFADAISTQSQPVIVDLIRNLTAGSFSGAAPTPAVIGPVGSSAAGVWAFMSSVPPAQDGVALDGAEFHPQAGYEYTFPLGDEPEIPGGGRVAIQVLASNTVGIRAKLTVKE